MDFGIAFALGLLGSLHCAAMCGPLLLALPVAVGGAGRFIAGRVIYQLGRVLTYALLGILAGVLGKSVILAGCQRWLSIALGVAVLVGFFVSKKIAVSTPAGRSRRCRVAFGKYPTSVGNRPHSSGCLPARASTSLGNTTMRCPGKPSPFCGRFMRRQHDR